MAVEFYINKAGTLCYRDKNESKIDRAIRLTRDYIEKLELENDNFAKGIKLNSVESHLQELLEERDDE